PLRPHEPRQTLVGHLKLGSAPPRLLDPLGGPRRHRFAPPLEPASLSLRRRLSFAGVFHLPGHHALATAPPIRHSRRRPRRQPRRSAPRKLAAPPCPLATARLCPFPRRPRRLV